MNSIYRLRIKRKKINQELKIKYKIIVKIIKLKE